MIRSRIFRWSLLGAFAFLLGFSYDYHLPKIESFLLVQAERFTSEHTPVRVWAKQLHFHLLPLGVVLEDVRILPQAPLDKYLAPASLKTVGARLAFWPLLRGEVRLSEVFVRDSEFNVFLKNDLFEGKKSPRKFNLDFEQLYSLPIDEISLDNVQIQGRLDPQNVVFRVSNLSLLVENRYQSIYVETSAPRVLIKPSGPATPLNVQLDLRALVEAHEMQVSAFTLKADQSFVVASGRFNGDFSIGRFDNGAFNARSKLQLPDLNRWESVFSLKPKLPALLGRTEVDLNMEIQNAKAYKLEAELKTRDVRIDKFLVGEINGHLSSDLKTVTSDLLRFANSAGEVELSRLKLQLEPKIEISSDVKVKQLEVHQLLENLNVQHVPIVVPAKGEATCHGQWGEKPSINCSGKIVAQRVHVDNGRPQFSTIVEAEDARVVGDATVTLQQVEYKAELELGKNSRGRSDGVISYEDGFKINYQGDQLDFKDVKNLANLKVEGSGKIIGNTKGTAKWATIDMNVDGKDLWLEDYPLGAASTKMTYKTSHLQFDNASGQYGSSRYTGAVDIDLEKKRLKVAGQIPFMDLRDVQNLFQRKVKLPLQFTGTGTGQVQGEGPFRFQDMSYNFKSNFYRGSIAGESFDEMNFHVKSKNGLVKTEKFNLTKGNGLVDIKGQITPQGIADVVMVGRGLRLEQSENVLNSGLDLQGLADFTVRVTGQLPYPGIELNGRLSKVVLADQAKEDSVFKLNFRSDRVEGSGQFLGNALVTDFTYPYDNEAPFSLKLKSHKWDFTSLFSSVAKSARQQDFSTSLSMDVQLQAPHGGLWASSGQVRVSEFEIHKGAKQMVSDKPMLLEVKQGVVNSENCVLTSGDTYLKLDVADLKRNHLNASLNGKVDLGILGVFTPFISEMRGILALSVDLKGSADHPQFGGSAYVEKGYAKLTEFVHPFVNVRADVLFNDNQVLINAFRSDLAGGKLSAEGKVAFKAPLRPIDIRGTFSDVTLNIPDGFKTKGSGRVAIYGNRFPYTLEVNYDINGGEIISEFSSKNSGGATVKASPYLPHFLDQEAFHPFNFLIDANLVSPVQLNNSLAQGSITGRVKATGPPDQLLLTGTFTPLPGSKVFFNSTPFEVGSAYVEFNNSPPNDPKIYLTAAARITENVVDETKRSYQNQYDVSMLVQGRGQNPQLTFSSVPPLGQREIISLLALGVSSVGTGTGADVRSASENSNANAAIGGAILGKTGARQVKDALGVDVKVSSSAPTLADTAQPKVTLSKQWTPKLGASASSTIEASPRNNVTLEYKVNKSISVMGTWDSIESYQDSQKDTAPNVFGLDLQYKMQFK